MFSIAQRYLVLEILKSSAATTLILFIIFMSNTLGSVLSDVSEGETPIQALLPVLLGQSVQVLSLLLPLGFFLGVMFAFGKLYKDHELVVLQACGFGYRQLYKVMLAVLVPVFLLTALCSLWLGAEMLQRAKQIVEAENNTHEFQQLKVGQFNESKDKNQVFFMQSMSEDKLEVHDIVITRQSEDTQILETASKGRHKLDKATGDLFLEIGPGTRYEGKPGDADYHIIEFERHGILLEKKPLTRSGLKSEEKYLGQLIQSDHLKDRIELLWRFSLPVSLVMLGLLAVPLSYIAPRQGRFGKIGIALLVFIVYLNMLGFSKIGLETGKVPMWLNFWWVHLLFLVFSLIVLKQRTRWTWSTNQDDVK